MTSVDRFESIGSRRRPCRSGLIAARPHEPPPSDEEVTMNRATPAAACTAVRRDDVTPLCPHCDAELSEIHLRKLRRSFGMGRGFIFVCPHCRKDQISAN